MARMFAVERTISLLLSDKRCRPICNANPGDKCIPYRIDGDGGVGTLQEGLYVYLYRELWSSHIICRPKMHLKNLTDVNFVGLYYMA